MKGKRGLEIKQPLVEQDSIIAETEASHRAAWLIMDRNRSQTSSGDALAILRSMLDVQP